MSRPQPVECVAAGAADLFAFVPAVEVGEARGAAVVNDRVGEGEARGMLVAERFGEARVLGDGGALLFGRDGPEVCDEAGEGAAPAEDRAAELAHQWVGELSLVHAREVE